MPFSPKNEILSDAWIEELRQAAEDCPMDLLDLWFRTNQHSQRIRHAEALMRGVVFKHFFPQPKEGTNNADLPDGYKLKAVHTINRSIDEAVYSNMKDKLDELGVPESIVRQKPELAKSVYKQLGPEAKVVFDMCLTAKPGSPQISIVKPKKSV